MYERIQARREEGGIRVALSTAKKTVEDFVWCRRSTQKGILETVEKFYGLPASGRIEVVKQFQRTNI